MLPFPPLRISGYNDAEYEAAVSFLERVKRCKKRHMKPSRTLKTPPQREPWGRSCEAELPAPSRAVVWASWSRSSTWCTRGTRQQQPGVLSCAGMWGCALLCSAFLCSPLPCSLLGTATCSPRCPLQVCIVRGPGVQEQQVAPLSSSHLPSLGIRRSTVYSWYSSQALRGVPEMKPHTESVWMLLWIIKMECRPLEPLQMDTNSLSLI